MRICVFGAGAIGGHLAARLARGGAEVCVVARGANLAAMHAHGLRVRTPAEELHVRVAASDDPAALGEQDAVIVTAKAPALPSVAAGISPLLSPQTAVAFVMNGIPWWYFHRHGGALEGTVLPGADPGGALHRAIGPGRVVGSVVYSACTVTEPGVISVGHARNRLILGEPDGSLSARAEAIAAPLRAGGMIVDVSPRIRDWVWSKLVTNLSSGAFSLLAQATPREVYTEPACEAAARVIYAEAGAIAAALGSAPDLDVDAQLDLFRGLSHKPSILQDMELGRPMEIDAIYDAPLRLARLMGVETPTLDLLVGLARVRARAAGLYAG